MTERRAGPKSPSYPRSWYPSAYHPDAGRPDIFDPALKHYPRAFVQGTPALSEDVRRGFVAAHSAKLRACLRALASDGVRDDVVVRGSVTLEDWYPTRARAARDIDLVVRDASWGPSSVNGQIVLTKLRGVIERALRDAGAEILKGEVTLDDIWTYERAEGRRITVPWRSTGALRDVIQLDVTFREPLQDEPVRTLVQGDEQRFGYRSEAPYLWYASRAESLAWKILWLETDMYPQGKDVYDAVLLAEDTPLPLDLARRVYEGKNERWDDTRHRTDFLRKTYVDWSGFTSDYPALATENPELWLERLTRTLRFT